MLIPLDKIFPNPDQPRREFDQADLEGLATSLKECGQLQPVVVYPDADHFVLLAGERRLRAARLNGWSEIEAVVRPPLNGDGPVTRLLLALTENVQRADMNPVEEANAYAALRNLGLSVSQISERVGVNIGTIYNRLELLKLEQPIQELFAAKKLSAVRPVVNALLSIPDPATRISFSRRMAARSASAQTIVTTCARLAAVEDGRPADPSSPPVMQYARSKSPQPADKTRWDALATLGHRPPWSIVQQAAAETCKACPINDIASKSVCRDCQAVELLRRMMEA